MSDLVEHYITALQNARINSLNLNVNLLMFGIIIILLLMAIFVFIKKKITVNSVIICAVVGFAFLLGVFGIESYNYHNFQNTEGIGSIEKNYPNTTVVSTSNKKEQIIVLSKEKSIGNTVNSDKYPIFIKKDKVLIPVKDNQNFNLKGKETLSLKTKEFSKTNIKDIE